MKTLYACIIICFIVGCNTTNNKRDFSIPPSSIAMLNISEIELDTILLDSIPTSYVVESSMRPGKIYLLDKLFCILYQFDSEGRIQQRYLGQGRAKNETTIGRVATHTFVGDDLLLLDHSGGYHLYDKDFYRKNYFRLIYDRNWELNKIYETPKAYTQRYNDIVCRFFNGNIFFNVHLAHSNYNILTTTKTHLERSANIQEISLQREDFGRLLAIGYPDSYRHDLKRKAILSAVVFDIDYQGDFYLTYEADSLIYVYDKNFHMKQCYGFRGRNMDLNYKVTSTPEEVGQYYREERNSKGFYNWLEYIDETNILFRSYQKGVGNVSDGLQIYQDGILIGDVNVPKGLKIMGYIKPYYYSRVLSDEKHEKIYLYKFKL